MRKGLLVIMALLLSCIYVSAADGYISVSSDAVKDRIMLNELATFDVTIENNLDVADSFRIYYSDVEWSFSTEPRTASTVVIPAGGKKTVRVVFQPLYVGYGTHGVALNVRAIKSQKLIKHTLFVSIISLGEWSPGRPIAVRTEISIPREINPSQVLDFRIDLENQYAINITNLHVTIDSSLFSVNRTINLRPLETKPMEFQVILDPMTKPQSDLVIVKLSSEGSLFKELERTIEVIAYASLEQEELTPIKKILRTDKAIVVTNVGNARIMQKIKTEAPSFSRLYVFTKPGYRVVREEGKQYFVWDLAIDPGEKTTIWMVESYRPIILIHLLVIIIILSYFYFRTPIILKKEASTIDVAEGGLSRIKIILHLRNRTNKNLKNIKVLDRVPNLADIVKTFKVGSLKPVKVMRSEKKGSIAKWFIEDLEAGEERVIVYHIQARLTILGGFELPTALIKFRDTRGRERVTSSNKLSVKV